jgi:hypothetical protein|tara:strand:+ start:17 stop:397 length:381 start_codon:yes stop_codon:yes gene_type:complete
MGGKTAQASNDYKLFSETDYEKGDVVIKKEVESQLIEKLNSYLLKGAGILISTILGGLSVIVWNMNSDLGEVKGKVSTPDTYLKTIDQRLNKLESENKVLQSKNYQLEIEKLKLNLKLEKKVNNGS